MLGGSIFCLLLPCDNIWGTLDWDTLWSLCCEPWSLATSPLHSADFMGVFRDWRRQPCSTSCAFFITCCVFYPSLISGILWILFGQKSFDSCELGCIPFYPFHFQNMPPLSICVPGLWFPLAPPAPMIHGYCCKNWQLGNTEGPNRSILNNYFLPF